MSSFFPRAMSGPMLLPGCCHCPPELWLEEMEHILKHPKYASRFADLMRSGDYARFVRTLARNLTEPVATADQVVTERLSGLREPHRIFQLFFAHEAVEKWRELFRALSPMPYTVHYDAVFVHQKPYVRFPGGRCELGDVLILFVDSFDKRIYAQFLQAKMIEEWPPNPSAPQWLLYTQWPQFEYAPTPGQKEIRDLRFPGPVGCAKYLLLDDLEKRAWLCPATVGGHAISMSEQVTNYFSGLDLRPVAWARDSCRNDWDHLIWDLIAYTSRSALPSGQVDGATGIRGTWLSRWCHVNEPASDKGDQGGWGISLIVIEAGISQGEE